MNARVLLSLVALLGCASAKRVPVANIPVDKAAVVTPPSPAPEVVPTFHVVVRGFPGSLERPSRLTLCQAGSEMFLCGTNVVAVLRGRDFVIDHAYEEGLPHRADGRLDGLAKSIEGHFPDDAWLLFATGDYERPFRYYRWRTDRWTKVFEPKSASHSLAYDVSLLRSGDQPLFMTTDLDTPSQYFAPLGGKTPSTGSNCSSGPPLPDGSLVFVAAPCAAQTAYTRLFSDGHRELVPFAKQSASIDFGSIETIAYGGETGPYLAKLEGKQWRELDTGPIEGIIRAYGRAPNAAWALADRLYRKPNDEGWSEVDAPAHIRGMWVTAADDVWLLHWEGRDAVILHTFPPTRELHLDWQ